MELASQNSDLKKAEEKQVQYINVLNEMMFITSHKIRLPIANILGIADLLKSDAIASVDEIKKMVGFVNESAEKLDIFTKELTTFITAQELEMKKEG